MEDVKLLFNVAVFKRDETQTILRVKLPSMMTIERAECYMARWSFYHELGGFRLAWFEREI